MLNAYTFAKIMQTCSELTERKDKRNKVTTLPKHIRWEKLAFADLLHISRHSSFPFMFESQQSKREQF